MPRIRQLKPGFYRNEQLGSIPFEARILYTGLWCLADREGRLEDRPIRIDVEIFPYDDVDCEALLRSLAGQKLIVRYSVAGVPYIAIPTWNKHQKPHVKEPASTIPAPGETQVSTSFALDWKDASTVQNYFKCKEYNEPGACTGLAPVLPEFSSAGSGFLVLGSGVQVLGSGTQPSESVQPEARAKERTKPGSLSRPKANGWHPTRWEDFKTEYPKNVFDFDSQLYVSVIETAADEETLHRNLVLWKRSQGWREGFVPSAENFLSKRMWKQAPKADEQPRAAERSQSTAGSERMSAEAQRLLDEAKQAGIADMTDAEFKAKFKTNAIQSRKVVPQ